MQRRPELFPLDAAIGGSRPSLFSAGAGQRLYPVASAERSIAWLEKTSKCRSGQAATSWNNQNAIVRLSEAIARVGGLRLAAAADPHGERSG